MVVMVLLTPVTDDIFQLSLMPRSGVNAYLVGEVLVDAGFPFHASAIVKALTGRTVATHVLTHAHRDHAGGSKKASDTLGVPVWCGASDADAARAGKLVAASGI